MYDKDLLESSHKFRSLVEAEESEDYDHVETLLLMVLDVYIRDQECASGEISNPFFQYRTENAISAFHPEKCKHDHRQDKRTRCEP